jgi:hypothetical protein
MNLATECSKEIARDNALVYFAWTHKTVKDQKHFKKD